MIKYILIFISIALGFVCNLFLFKIYTCEKIKYSLKAIILLTLFSILLSYFNLLGQTMLLTFGNLIFTMCLISIFYRNSIFESIYYSVIIWLIELLSDVVVSLFLVGIGINYINIKNEYLFRCILLFPVIIIEIFFVWLPYIRKIVNNTYEKYFNKVVNSTIFKMALFLLIYVFLILIYLTAYRSFSKISYYTITIIMIISLIILFFLIKYMIELYELSNINKNIINENKLLKEMADKESIFRHNLLNNLIGVESISTGKSKKVINDLINSYKSEYKNIDSINKLPSGIDGLIYKKVYLKNLTNLNLIVENEVKENIFKILSPRKYNILIESIGILLDNSLEAVESCNKKVIIISIYSKDKCLYFEIKNNFNVEVDIDKLGTKKYTTKKEGHGIGLDYLIKNKNVSIKSEIINNFFNIILKITTKK